MARKRSQPVDTWRRDSAGRWRSADGKFRSAPTVAPRSRGRLLVPSGWKKDKAGRWRDGSGHFAPMPSIRLVPLEGPPRERAKDARKAIKKAERLQADLGPGKFDTGRVWFEPKDKKAHRRKWSVTGFRRFMSSPKYRSKRARLELNQGSFFFAREDREGRPMKRRQKLMEGEA